MLRKHQCYQNIFICFVLVKSMHKKCIIWEELNMFSCLLMTVNVKGTTFSSNSNTIHQQVKVKKKFIPMLQYAM